MYVYFKISESFEGFEGTLFMKLSWFENKDVVRVHNCFDSVGDSECGPSFWYFVKSILD